MLCWESLSLIGLLLCQEKITIHSPYSFSYFAAGFPATRSEMESRFLKNDCEIPEFLRGKYHRMNAIAKNEELTEEATMYVRENAFKKGAADLTARSFCSWVNDDLLPNSTLEASAPRRISVEVARRWLHEMGFKVRRITKGIYYDGHERDDVIDHRKKFLGEMSTLGFLHASNAPNEAAAELVKDVALDKEWENTIYWFHDESMFNANELPCGKMKQCKSLSRMGEVQGWWYLTSLRREMVTLL